MADPVTPRPAGTQSSHWMHRWRVGRVEVGFHLWIHHPATLSDRWVFQPVFIYDRAEPSL